MYKKSICFIFFVLFFCFANENDNIAKTSHGIIIKEASTYKYIYTMRNKDDVLIGDVYANMINDTVFTDLFIMNKVDTIYMISHEFFFNPKNVDLKVLKDGFYGYRFVMKNKDYIVLSYLTNKGKNVSDDITIEWNYKKLLMEVQKEP
jgi:hypothetical protein